MVGPSVRPISMCGTGDVCAALRRDQGEVRRDVVSPRLDRAAVLVARESNDAPANGVECAYLG